MSATQPRPGIVFSTRTAPSPRTVPTDTGVWFVAGLTEKGPLTPIKVSSLQDFINKFGGRVSYSVLYDALELFFREGGAEAYVSRVVGADAEVATVNLDDASAGGDYSLVVNAKGPGDYANDLNVTSADVTGGFQLTITDDDDNVLETSPVLATQDAAVAWSVYSAYVDIVLGAADANPDEVTAAALAGGDDDRSAITDDDWVIALTRFNMDLGPGQVTQVGRTSTQAHSDTLVHAAANNRRAILDLPDSASPGALQAAAVAQKGAIEGAAFGPWLVCPGLLPNTTRIAPPSGFVCGKIAEVQSNGGTENTPAASENGAAKWAIGLSQPAYDDGSGIDVTRDAMYSDGVNLIVFRYGVIEVFGWRTLVDPDGPDQTWLNFGNSRLKMGIMARANKIGERYILKEINKRLIGKFKGELIGMLVDYYNAGSLFGDTPEEAFQVDTGSTVNTPDRIANRELHAGIGARMSEDAELISFEFVKVPVNQSL